MVFDANVFFNIHTVHTEAIDLFNSFLNECVIVNPYCKMKIISFPLPVVAIGKVLGV